MNLYQKMSAVMADVKYLNKDDKVDIGNGRSYNAVTEEKVTSTIRESLIKNGLVIFPIQTFERREDEEFTDKYGNIKKNRITTISGQYKIVNIDAPEEYEILSAVGCGADTQDKGAAKAQTMLYKYLLLRTFGIPTGDDPDKISSEVYTAQITGQKVEQPEDDEKARAVAVAVCQKLFDTATDAVKEKCRENLKGREIGTLDLATLGKLKLWLVAQQKITEAKK